MFEQHAVPQNISSYQFHLVGDMTLKQFLELGGGVLVGVVIYALGLPGIIKWPLILISTGFGAALAFVPFEERPLEQWLFAFFRSIYSPTLFHWEKNENIKYFQEETSQGTGPTVSKSMFANVPFLNKLEESENTYLSKIFGMFNPTPMGIAKPKVIQSTTQLNEVKLQAATEPTQAENLGTVLTENVINQNQSPPLTPVAGTKNVNVPQTTYISVNTQNRPQVHVEEIPQLSQTPVDLTPTTVGGITAQEIPVSAKQALFSTDAAPPSIPTIPNTVSGQVMDSSGKIIEGAILEINDATGRPVRALKTNKAGHFLIVTALTDGKYNLITEKEGLNFDPVEFEAKGQIIAPIAIRAK